jgi:membrane carboxypeptidase/penicillin-binding protein
MIVDQAYARRFGASFAALLLATMLAVASDAAKSGASELTYGVGRVFHTSLSDAHLLGDGRRFARPLPNAYSVGWR